MTGAAALRHQFTGEYRDATPDHYYLRARYYDPLTGRFLTRDPFPGFATEPQSQNPYAYVSNNPVRYTDPSGLCAAEANLGLLDRVSNGLADLFDNASESFADGFGGGAGAARVAQAHRPSSRCDQQLLSTVRYRSRQQILGGRTVKCVRG